MYQVQRDEYLISDDKEKLNVLFIHQYLSKESYWAQNIPEEIVRRSIDNALCFGVYYNYEQIGFARTITDKATFAYLADVFIIEKFRGKGLSKWLMEAIHAHPDLQRLRRWMLATKDAHGLYAQFGWSALSAPERMMEKRVENIYLQY